MVVKEVLTRNGKVLEAGEPFQFHAKAKEFRFEFSRRSSQLDQRFEFFLDQGVMVERVGVVNPSQLQQIRQSQQIVGDQQ